MNNKLALGIIVAPTDREAELLDRLLGGVTSQDQVQKENKNINLDGVDGVAKHVDSIYVTITGENAKCEEVAKKYNANISHYKWDENFANARKFNFSQIPDDYFAICWADADDVIVHPELLKPLVDQMYEEAIDAVPMMYFYEHDLEGNCIKQHLKTRLIRNDGGMEWSAAIHEDFKRNRDINGKGNLEVKYIHLTDPVRVKNSLERNTHISELEVQKHPEDPHSYWNLANSYLSIGRYEDAINIYKQFIGISESEEERFLSWQMLAVCYNNIGKLDLAIEMALEALNLRPWYPDSYILLGQINYHIGRMKAAKDFLETGLTKPVPELESIVWNPMDYTFNPNLLLAQINASLYKHREALECFKKCLKYRPKSEFIKDAISSLEKELVKSDMAEEVYKRASVAKTKDEVTEILKSLPEEMKYYPPIVSLRHNHFIKTESSGKDLAIFCSFTSHEWNPEVFRTTGVGGSEEAIVQLSKRFAKAGYNVTVFCSTPKMQDFYEDGVAWKPWLDWNQRDRYDIVILWRHPKMLDYPINCDNIYMDVHDVIPPEEFTPSRLLKVKKIMFKSKTQRDYYKNIPDSKCAVVVHGLDIKDFEEQRDKIKKNPYLILNTSSPDRGLKTFMKIIKKVYDKLDDKHKSLLKCSQYYGFDIWDYEFSDNETMMKWKDDTMKEAKELMDLGIMTKDSCKRLSQTEITKKYLEAGVLLYPSEFAEIGYIGGIKGMLAGCIPFTTSAFAQGEFAKDGVIVKSEASYDNDMWRRDLADGGDYGVKTEEQINEFVDKLVEYIKNPERFDDMRKQLVEYAKNNFNWDATADSWVSIFNGKSI